MYFVCILQSVSILHESFIHEPVNITIMVTRMGSFVGSLETFELSKGTDWTLYVQRFEHFAKANKVADDDKLHLL